MRKDQSMWVVVPSSRMSRSRSAPCCSHARRPALHEGNGCLAAMWKACVMGFVLEKIAASAKVAHLTRVVFVWQQKFYIADERLDASGGWRSGVAGVPADDSQKNPPR